MGEIKAEMSKDYPRSAGQWPKLGCKPRLPILQMVAFLSMCVAFSQPLLPLPKSYPARPEFMRWYCTPALGTWIGKDQEFKNILDYLESWRPD